MAVRIATFTVRVAYDTDRILNPGHLIGGMTDEILGWNSDEDNKRLGVGVEVTDAQFEDEAQAARREALFMVGLGLDASANGHDPMTQHVFNAVRKWCDLESRADTFGAYIELQQQAMALGHGQK
jgi:hypothetical protein